MYDVTFCLAAWSHVSSGKGGSYAWSHVPSRWGLCQGGSLSMGSLSRGKGSLSRGSLSGTPPGQRPTYGEEPAVRILLECFLVLVEFNSSS